MSTTKHPDSPELVALQEERDKVYKEMLMFKEQVIELKEKVVGLEKEKVELMVSKSSYSQKNT